MESWYRDGGYIRLKRHKVQKYFTCRLSGRCQIAYQSYAELITFVDIDSLDCDSLDEIRFNDDINTY